MAIVELNHVYPIFKASDFSEYDITHFEVIARGDEKVGTVSSILADDQTGHLRYFVVDVGFWLFGKRVLLPIGLGMVVYMDRCVYVENLTKEQIKSLPEYTDDTVVDTNYEEKIRTILNPLVETNARTSTYDQDKEPYFYVIQNEQLQAIQNQIIAKRK